MIDASPRVGGTGRLRDLRIARCALACAATGLALAAAGCGYSVPFFARPEATPQVARATPAHAEQSTKRHARAARHSKSAHAEPEVVRAAAPRDPLEEARANALRLPTEAYWPYHAAELFCARSAADSALDALRGSLARNGGYAPALALFSKLEYDADRHDDAIAVLESARLAAQRAGGDLSPALLAGLALHYAAAGRAADSREALSAVPHTAHAAADPAAAALALRDGDAEAARRLAEAALDANPKSAACLNNAGIARLRAGDVAGARKAWLEAIRLEPRRAGPYYNLTILEKYYALDDDAAADWFAKYRALSDDDPDQLGAALGKSATKDLAEGGRP